MVLVHVVGESGYKLDCKIWAYGTVDGSCLMAPAFTIVWVLKDEIADTFKVIFMDDYTFEDEEEFDSVKIGKRHRYCQLKKGA